MDSGMRLFVLGLSSWQDMNLELLGAILLSQKESLLEKEANTDNSRAARSRFLATPFSPHLEPATPKAPEFFV